MDGLMLGGDLHAATMEQVEQVETPTPTLRWVPIPHHVLVQHVITALEGAGLDVVKQAHGLWRDGSRYFGVLQLENGQTDYATCVGLRNAHDKVFSVGMAVGSDVFVCDNLSFSSEITMFRKHTTHILRDLPRITAQAVGKIGNHRNFQALRFDAYKQLKATDGFAHDIVVRAVDAKIITTSRIPHVLKHWRESAHEEFKARNAWSLFNAFTEVLKGSNQLQLPQRTMRLHGLLDAPAGVGVDQGTAADAAAIN